MQYLSVEGSGVVSPIYTDKICCCFFIKDLKNKQTNNNNVNDTNGKVLHQQRETCVCAAKFMFPERIWKS